ncbi:MAG: aminoacyl-tRNA hydrolase [Desulfuromonadales bacterium]|nr:aminoacyl-tRNA hydrolase [Desulfuromonadales bacterium]MBN2791026.1 aminoacyl-tRNA hydrolase [Desulfuromonadales bacterium]
MRVTEEISIPKEELEIRAVHSQGAGGQHVNKVASGIHLRFDIQRSSLPEEIKHRLMQRSDKRISKEGVLIIKSQQSRSQEKNRINALQILAILIQKASVNQKQRKQTRPTRSAIEKRIDKKKLLGQTKELRKKIIH